MKQIVLTREPVALFNLLKFEGLASSGGEAKHFIAAGRVKLNGTTETRKRKKIVHGDMIEIAGQVMQVVLESNTSTSESSKERYAGRKKQ